MTKEEKLESPKGEKKTIKKVQSKETVETAEKKTQPRLLKGKVVSDKMKNTVVVAVNKYIQHKKYKKRYIMTKKYKAHDEKEEYSIGDKVIIQEIKPMSKHKTWKVISKY